MPFQPDLPGLLTPVIQSPERQNTSLESFPDVSSRTLSHYAKVIGRAGELFVDSLLTRYGELILAVPEDQPFDRLIRRGERVLTLQIKTSARAVGGVFKFAMKKGYSGSTYGIRGYSPEDYDIAALVALPENVVMFSADRRESHRIGVDQIGALRADPRASYLRALEDIGFVSPCKPRGCQSLPHIPAC